MRTLSSHGRIKALIDPFREDLRDCDCCGRESLYLEQSSCLTSHVEKEDFPDLINFCSSDEFYCDQCLNELGFCDNCSESTSMATQKKVFNYLNKVNK